MPLSTIEPFRRIAYAESSGDGLIDLIELTYDEGTPTTLRLARNGVAIVSNGETYDAFWFEIMTPTLRIDGSFTQSKLRIDAVDQRIVLALRSVTRPMTLVHFMVLISDPDTVARGTWTYQVRDDQSWDNNVVELNLAFAPALQEMCPSKRLSPSRAPGLF